MVLTVMVAACMHACMHSYRYLSTLRSLKQKKHEQPDGISIMGNENENENETNLSEDSNVPVLANVNDGRL